MNVIETKIKGLLILEPKVFGDDRGWFMESFNQKAFEQALNERELDIPQFVQDNHSLSQKGVLRGLHYQLNPYAQGKLVRVVQGRAWDVAVDIRKNSPTFVGSVLSASVRTITIVRRWIVHTIDRHHNFRSWIVYCAC